jgi:membrane protein implicated in regulation of membrane protease activity
MDFELYQFTLAAAILFVVIEIVTGTFLFLGLGLGLIPVVIFHALTGEVELGRDIAVFALVSACSFVALRKSFLKRSDTSVSTDDINKY